MMEDIKQTPDQAEQTASTDSMPMSQAPSRPKFPTIGDLLAMVGIVFVGQVVGGLVSILFGLSTSTAHPELTPDEQGKFLFVSVLIANVVTLAGLLIYRSVRGGRGPIARFSAKGFNPALILWGFLLILASGVVLEPLLNLLPPLPIDKFGTGVWTMLSLVLVAPIFEEFICRGVVLESLRSRYGVIVAWLVSAAFFGVIHLYPQQVVNAFFIGLILAFLYLRTNSIWIVIILHLLNNALAYLCLLLGIDGSLIEMIDNRTMYGMVYFAAAVLCVISGVMVWQTFKTLAGEDKNSKQA